MIFDKISTQIRTLVDQEIASAKAEVSARAKLNAVGIALIAGAATLAALALGALTTAAIVALDTALSLWLSAVIVAVVYLVVAAILGIAGKGKLKKGGPPLPTDTMHGFKDDVRRVRENGTTTPPIPGETKPTVNGATRLPAGGKTHEPV